MEIIDLKPGTPIEFTLASTNSNTEENIDEDRSVYLSSVFGVTKNDEIIFHIPTRQGHTVTIPMNIPFIAVFNTGKTMFQLQGVVTKRGRLEEFPVYVFEPFGKLSKVQRRDYFRLPCYIPNKVLPIPKDVALLPNMAMVEDDLERFGDTYGTPLNGTILDISGGGARFHTRQELQVERYMYMSFILEQPGYKHQINVIARLVKAVYYKELMAYEYRSEFLFKDPEDREIIIKYIFDEDRRLRKKDQG